MLKAFEQTHRPFPLRTVFRTLLFTVALVAASAVPGAAQQDKSEEARQIFRQGRKHLQAGRLNDAESTFRRALEADPSLSTAKVELAYTLLRRRSIRAAYDLSLEVASAERSNSRAFAVLGSVLLTAGRFTDARPVFLTALATNRNEHLAWAGLGLLDFYENRINEGLNSLREASYHEPDEPDYLYALGQVAARAESYKEAAEAYRRFLQVARDVDHDRRLRIEGLVNFLNFLGNRKALYATAGPDSSSVPFELIGNRPVITVKVNDADKPLRFVLDTGSGMTVLSDQTARALKIKPIARGGYAKGIGGNGKFEIVYGFVRSFAIGDVRIKSVPVYIRQFHADAEKVDGYIGLSLISKFLTTIDYGQHTFSLAKKDSQAEAAAAAESDHSLPLRLTSSGFLSGEVQLEGLDSPLNFIVDTGASVSVISDEIARMEPFTRYARSQRMRVIGSAGVTEDVPSLELPRITFGNHSRDRLTALALNLGLINEASGFEQSGILGGNFLRNYRLTFDFKNSKVTFVPVAKQK